MKLFLRIFLSFWLATALMIGAVLAAGEFWPATFPGDELRRFSPEATEYLLTQAVNTYEREGAAALSQELQRLPALRRHSFFLYDDSGKIIAGTGTPSRIYEQITSDVRQGSREELQRFGFKVLFACQVHSASGRRYIGVLTVSDLARRLMKLHLWFDLAIALPPAALVCMLLSLYITRPITRLRSTAQRLAEGDLSARSSPHRILRRDELGDLARDFDIMAAQIESLMTAQRRFVADVSHELGAPLTRMHLALALLRRHYTGRSGSELERIERETDKLSNLVQQLLLLAGLEAGRCPAETLASVSLRSLCESIVEDANFEAAHANCVIAGRREDAELMAYPHLLRRAVDNVLRNAIRYAPPQSEVILNATVDQERQLVTLEVLDSGPGVPKSMLQDIFRPFFRTSPGRESETGGTGLGLAIAFEAVRMHEGTITANNRDSGGLEVTITLPLRAPFPETELQSLTDQALS
jgi:two-component system, OmpR family, sensor histidine kinase CpxA